MNGFTTASVRGIYDFNLNEKTRNNEDKQLKKNSIHQLPNTFTKLKLQL